MNIVVMSLGFLGDTLMVGPLCKNIRKQFPESRIIFIVNKVFEDVPKGFKEVDEIFPFDKKELHKGLKGYLKFAKDFPYRGQVDYCIITHEHERSLITAKLIGSKHIISKPVKNSPLNLFIDMKRNIVKSEIENSYVADYFSEFIRPIADNIEYFPVEYNRFDVDEDEILKKFGITEPYMVLSPTSKDMVKDWDYVNVKNFIKNSPLPVVLIGTEKAFKLGQELISDNVYFIDLTNRTNITEVGAIIKKSDICVSVDTGTLHFAYAQKVKTIGIFFSSAFKEMWAPKNSKCIKILLGQKNIKNDGSIEFVKNVNYNQVLDIVNECITVKADKNKT